MSDATQIPPDRRQEYDAIVALLLEHASEQDLHAEAVAHSIARASLAQGHMWREMRLPARSYLRGLFAAHFPQLAADNTRDMRWKRFLYKKLCGWPGFDG